MIDNKDLIIKSLCDTINRLEREVTYLIRDNDILKEENEDLREKVRENNAGKIAAKV